MKIAIIAHCPECPHHYVATDYMWNPLQGWKCRLTDDGIPLEDGIPSWCPLEDVPDCV